MRLDALIHLSRAVLAMAEVDQLVIFGSASLLVSFPELGEREDSPLQLTYDADLIPMPFEEEIGLMLDEAFGEDRAFHKRFGYHADIVRSKITETFPRGWEERLLPLAEVPGARCLEPHDMAAAKCLVGREKDRKHLRYLIGGFLQEELIRQRVRTIPMPENILTKGLDFLQSVE